MFSCHDNINSIIIYKNLLGGWPWYQLVCCRFLFQSWKRLLSIGMLRQHILEKNIDWKIGFQKSFFLKRRNQKQMSNICCNINVFWITVLLSVESTDDRRSPISRGRNWKRINSTISNCVSLKIKSTKRAFSDFFEKIYSNVLAKN